MLSDYAGVFIYFGFMLVTGALLVAVSHLCQLRVPKDKYDWTRPYECGIKTSGHELGRYPIHYYLVGILFVVFDVETVFFIPWAVIGNEFKLAELHAFWFIEMLVFLVILVVGYIYLLSSGVFNWGHRDN